MAVPVKGRDRTYVFDCILQALRSNYFVDSLVNARKVLKNESFISESWGYRLSPWTGDDKSEIHLKRIHRIAEFVFSETESFPIECLDTICHIIVQMASTQ